MCPRGPLSADVLRSPRSPVVPGPLAPREARPPASTASSRGGVGRRRAGPSGRRGGRAKTFPRTVTKQRPSVVHASGGWGWRPLRVRGRAGPGRAWPGLRGELSSLGSWSERTAAFTASSTTRPRRFLGQDTSPLPARGGSDRGEQSPGSSVWRESRFSAAFTPPGARTRETRTSLTPWRSMSFPASANSARDPPPVATPRARAE